MKKINLFILFVLLIPYGNCIAQNLIINELNVSDIKSEFNENEFSHDMNNGPFLIINFSINNNLDKALSLDLKSSRILITFNYEDQIFEKNPIWNFLYEQGEISLNPKESRSFSVSVNLFIGTKLIKKKNTDYSLDLLKTLPTIQLRYIDNTGTKITSRGVNKVTTG